MPLPRLPVSITDSANDSVMVGDGIKRTFGLLMPFAMYVAGMLLERLGNVPLYWGLGFTSAGLVFLAARHFYLAKGKGHVDAKYRGTGRFAGIWPVPLFLGCGLCVASVSARTDVAVAASHPEFGEWVNRHSGADCVRIKAEKIITGEFGETVEGFLTDAGRWNGWKVKVRGEVGAARNGDVVEVPARCLAGGYARRGEMVPVERIVSPNWADSCHGRMLGTLESLPLEQNTKGFLAAVLLGEKDMVSGSLRSGMADAGLAHMLALSGMHVGIIGGMAFLLLWPLKAMGMVRLRRLGAVLLVWVFVMVTGMGVSTVRAALMFSFSILALEGGRKGSQWGALAAGAAVLLTVNPDNLFSPGFQLSFMCVASLIAFAGPLNMVDGYRHPLFHKGVAAVMVPLVASVATWAVTAWYFGRVPLAFLPMNLVAVPLLPVYMGIALSVLVWGFFGLPPVFMMRLLDTGVEWLWRGSEWFGEGTVLELTVGKPVVFGWLAVLLILGVIAGERSRNPMQGQLGHGA